MILQIDGLTLLEFLCQFEVILHCIECFELTNFYDDFFRSSPSSLIQQQYEQRGRRLGQHSSTKLFSQQQLCSLRWFPFSVQFWIHLWILLDYLLWQLKIELFLYLVSQQVLKKKSSFWRFFNQNLLGHPVPCISYVIIVVPNPN